VVWGAPWVVKGHLGWSGGTLGGRGAPWVVGGAWVVWGHLGWSGVTLGGLGSPWVVWGHLGWSGGTLGGRRRLGGLGCTLGGLGCTLGGLGCTLGGLGCTLGGLGCTLGGLGSTLGGRTGRTNHSSFIIHNSCGISASCFKAQSKVENLHLAITLFVLSISIGSFHNRQESMYEIHTVVVHLAVC
jgi:hypothetical protein